MTIGEDVDLRVGDLWEQRGRALFLIADIRTTDSPVAILREVARHPEYQQLADITVAGYARHGSRDSNAERAARWNAPAVWEQDRLWFEKRADVHLWTGTVDEWRAAVRS